MGGSSKPATQTTNSTQNVNQTQTTTPWAPAQSGLQDMFNAATTAYGATPKTPVFTGPNANQTAGIDMLRSTVPQLSQGAGDFASMAAKTAAGGFLNPTAGPNLSYGGYSANDQNPNVEALISASLNPLRDQLDSNVLSIGDAAKLAGAYGGDRQDILKGQALGQFNKDALSMASGIRYNAWDSAQNRGLQQEEARNNNSISVYDTQAQQIEAERQRQMASGDAITKANQLLTAPGQLVGALGDQQSQWDIAAKQAAMDAPWAGLDRYSQILGQATPYATQNIDGTTTGNSTTTGTPAKGSQLGGAVSGALGGAAAGASFGPWGAAIGGALGGLGGLFGG